MSNPPFKQYTGVGDPPPGKPRLSRRDQPGRYLAGADLVVAVNTALAVEQPLLLTGEPGTGKTELAWSVASELGLPEVLEFHTRSDSEAIDLLYRFDNVRRFADAHGGKVAQLDHYVELGPLGRALDSQQRQLVLIDEIDKAPRDFPNDLLDVIDQMSFVVRETDRKVPAVGQRSERPIVIITSNVERQLPDPFLRRCVYHHIEAPDSMRLKQILHERLGASKVGDALIAAAVTRYEAVRKLDGLRKKPATHELISWVRVLHRAGVDPAAIENSPLKELFVGTLLKTQDDTKLATAREAAKGS